MSPRRTEYPMAQVKVTVTFSFETTPEELQKYLTSLGKDVKLEVNTEDPQDFEDEVSNWGLSPQTKFALIRHHINNGMTLQQVLQGTALELGYIRNLGPTRLREIMEKRPPHH